MIKKQLGTFSIAMISVIAVDSLRTLPFSAAYGAQLIFYYALAGLGFLLPISLVAAELASTWPNKGGIYVWIDEAFGDFGGFLAIWLQWLYNIIWYPTILVFLSSTSLRFFYPEWSENPYLITAITLLIFWITSFCNWFGLTFSSLISTLGALLGTIFPMLFIIVLGAYWSYEGHTAHIAVNLHSIIPDQLDTAHLGYFLIILFGLLGLEISAAHADSVEKPETSFPRGFLMAALIIFFTLTLSSLAIALVVPKNELSMVNGLTQAFLYFFNVFHLEWMNPIIVVLIIFGGMSCITTWLYGPAQGLWVSAKKGHFPKTFSFENQYGAPSRILMLQLILGSVLSLCFLWFPTINASYWFLTALTSQLAMLVYVLFFAAAIVLKFKHAEVKRPYEVPFGKTGMVILCSIGMVTCIAALLLGFIPPPEASFTNAEIIFPMLLLMGIFAALFIPWGIFRMCRRWYV